MTIRGRKVGVRCLAVLSVVAALMVPAVLPAAVAAPGLNIAKGAPAQVRADEPITYTLTVTNPSSNPDAINEYNISFNDTLPLGVTYVAGSTSPASAGEPTSSTDPVTGQVTLVWPNVADVVPDSDYTLTFQVLPDPATYPVGSTVTNSGANVFASSDPQAAPDFDANGVVVPGSYTESGVSGSTTTTISAVSLSKAEPSPESELLRGIHDHPTVYTLTVNATDAGASSGLVLVDYLPATPGVPRLWRCRQLLGPRVRRGTVADRHADPAQLPDPDVGLDRPEPAAQRHPDLSARHLHTGRVDPREHPGRRVDHRPLCSGNPVARQRFVAWDPAEPDRADPDRQPGQQHRPVDARAGLGGVGHQPRIGPGHLRRPRRTRALRRRSWPRHRTRSASRTSGCASRSIRRPSRPAGSRPTP